MEIFELRYFLGVARHENIHRASENLHVSPGSLSKAIARLEDELSVRLFSREGRGIRLTGHGRLFQRRAAEIVRLEESARLEIMGHEGTIQVVMAGPEILLAEMGVELTAKLRGKFPKTSFEYHAVTDEEAIFEITQGEAHLAFVTTQAPPRSGLSAKLHSEPRFQTAVGKGHPLYGEARSKKTIPVERVLESGFVSPDHPLLGKVGLRQSMDGWRDDEFPRRIDYRTSSLSLLAELVGRGRALAYLPDYYLRRAGLEILKISGCPYTCTQKVWLLAKDPSQRGWLNHLF